MKNVLRGVVITVLCVPAVALHAGVFNEVEPNNTMGTANVIARPAGPFAVVGFATLTAGGGDVDFFSLDLFAGEILLTTATPLEEFGIDPDTVMGLFNSAGDLLVSDDDGGPGLGSEIIFEVPADDTYFIAVSGFADFDFVGDHSQDGRYSLSVKVIPAPAGLAVFAGMFAFRRRRRG